MSIPSEEQPIPRTVAKLIAAVAERTPAAVALTAPGRKPLTFSRLNQLLHDGIASLNEMGIRRGDRVAIVLPNGPEMAAAFLAVSAGTTAAPLNPAYQQNDFEFYLTDLRAKGVILDNRVGPAARKAAAACGVPVIDLLRDDDAEAGTFSLSHSGIGTSASTGLAEPDDIALVLHTSGTTSRPKIVPLSHSNVCTSAENIRRTLQLTANDRCLNVMPLFHIHGLMAAVLSSLAAGGSVVCTPGFDAAGFFAWLGEFSPTWYTAVPTIHQSVLEQARRNADVAAGSRLRFIRSSSSALPPQVMRELEQAFGVPVIESYGMTEAAHQMCSNPLPPHDRKPGSVGIAAGPEVAIMDEAGNLLATGDIGEIVIRGGNVTSGYENNPAANTAAFTNSWFRTGDQGRMDAEGYVSLTGRLKEIINRGGEKISPREIDEALLDHPSVAQVVTFAVPHPSLGEDVAAAVVLRRGESVSEQEMRKFAFERLVEFKVPSRVLFVETIPKGPSGKLQRIGLHQHLAPLLQPPYAAPETGVEEILTEIWAEVLKAKHVGRNDNFFSLGGDSLLATRVVSRLRAALEVEIPLAALFRFPTVSEFALTVEELLLGEMELDTEQRPDSAS